LVRWCRAFLHAHPGVLDVQARDLWVEGESGVKGPLLVVLAVVGLFGYSWLQLAGNMFAALSGRLWLFVGMLVLYLSALPNLLVLDSAIRSAYPGVYRSFLDVLPYLAWSAVLLKFLLAGWAFRSAYQRGILAGRVIAVIVAGWSLTAGCLIALFALFL